MNETARPSGHWAIPRRLDDPERWLFWTLDEAAALLGPAVLGLAANEFVTGLAAGAVRLAGAAPGQARRRRQHRALRAVLVPARLRAAASGHPGEPSSPVRRMMRPER